MLLQPRPQALTTISKFSQLTFPKNLTTRYRFWLSMSTTTATTQDGKKTYHKQATGRALETVQAHAADKPLKFFGGCFWCARPPSFFPSMYLGISNLYCVVFAGAQTSEQAIGPASTGSQAFGYIYIRV